MTVHELATPLTGRDLTCKVCGTLVRVFELPPRFLDAERFVCGECLRGRR